MNALNAVISRWQDGNPLCVRAFHREIDARARVKTVAPLREYVFVSA